MAEGTPVVARWASGNLDCTAKRASAHHRGQALSASLLRPWEIAQVRRRLILAHRHQQAIGAHIVVLVADAHVPIALRTNELAPNRARGGVADIPAPPSTAASARCRSP